MINQNCGKDSENPWETAFSQQGVFRATQVVLAGLSDLPRSAEGALDRAAYPNCVREGW
jgi:hypothetical protein